MRDEIINELSAEIKDGKGCIVFDLGCYFPYSNWKDVLSFKFKLGAEELEPYVLNHRYRNHGYVTISKKSGRKLSKIGYPCFLELNMTHCILLIIEIGIQDQTVRLAFPIKVTLSQDKPVCGLTFHLDLENLDSPEFIFYSCKKAEDHTGWREYTWSNKEEKEPNERDIIMEQPTFADKYTLIYRDVITPFPQKLNELLML